MFRIWMMFLFLLVLGGCSRTHTVIHVSSTPHFRAQDDATYLVVHHRAEDIKLLWSDDYITSLPLTLDPNTRYDFTLEREEETFGEGEYRSVFYTYDLIEIKAGKDVLYNRAVCEVHHLPMKEMEVTIVYGLIMTIPPMPRPDHVFAARTFPHYSEQAWGGCCQDMESPKTTVLRVCSACKAAHEEWVKAHPVDPLTTSSLAVTHGTE